MYPILVSLGPVVIYTASVFYIVGWCIFSFVFWRVLRNQGLLEERIFDLTFYSTIIGLIFARLGFVFLYPSLFTTSILLIGAFWVQPGLWIYSGIIGVFFTLFFLSKRFNIRFANVFDAFVLSLVWALIPILLGIFFQGAEVGKESNLPWALPVAHYDGRRHPIQLYEIGCLVLIGLLSIWIEKMSVRNKWMEGLIGSMVLTIMTPILFALEFIKDGRVYLYGISVNQWLLIVIFAESCGSVIVKGNLKEKIIALRGGIYEYFAGRRTRRVAEKVTAGKTDDSRKDSGT